MIEILETGPCDRSEDGKGWKTFVWLGDIQFSTVLYMDNKEKALNGPVKMMCCPPVLRHNVTKQIHWFWRRLMHASIEYANDNPRRMLINPFYSSIKMSKAKKATDMQQWRWWNPILTWVAPHWQRRAENGVARYMQKTEILAVQRKENRQWTYRRLRLCWATG